MSTAPNYRELFNTYHNGYDNYPAWIDHHKTMHAKHPLECAEFGAEWLRRWEAVGRLLNEPAKVEMFDEFGSAGWLESLYGAHKTGYAIGIAHEEWRRYKNRVRVVLPDGTIVKEWGVT